MGKENIGLKIGASRLAAARVALNGSAELIQVAEEPLARASWPAARSRTSRRLPSPSRPSSSCTSCPCAASGSASRTTASASGRSSWPGSRIRSSLGTPFASAPRRRFRSRSTRRCSTTRCSPRRKNAEGLPSTRVLLVVAYRDLVDSYLQACKPAGIKLAGVDLEAFALLRALTPPVAADAPGASEALSSPSPSAPTASTLAVSDGLSCEFTRVLDWGGASLTGAIARALDVDADRAEELKRELSVEGGPVPEGLTQEQLTQAHEAIQVGLQTFGRELVSSLQFYQSQEGSLGIREVVLAGGASQLRRVRRGRREARRREGQSRRPADRDHRQQEAQGRDERCARDPHRTRDGPLMADWKKEIKLSDLFSRSGRGQAGAELDGPDEAKPRSSEAQLSEARPELLAQAQGAQGSRRSRRRAAKSLAAELRATAVPQIPLMRAFNLLPKDDPREGGRHAARTRPSWSLAVVALVALAGLGAYFLLLNTRVAGKTATRDELKTKLAAANVPAERAAAGRRGRPGPGRGEAKRTGALSSALGGRTAWDRLLREFSLVLPDDISLTKLTASGAVVDPAAAGRGGHARADEHVHDRGLHARRRRAWRSYSRASRCSPSSAPSSSSRAWTPTSRAKQSSSS